MGRLVKSPPAIEAEGRGPEAVRGMTRHQGHNDVLEGPRGLQALHIRGVDLVIGQLLGDNFRHVDAV